ncbi:hypothetical protein GDO81_007138 [Engystomops pustulosus]|uniref:Uncharacterized protein n=1 Tax=Engystomops pustulosus TaxID=76066 RepID=A0AAV7C6S4_ENGPU|nr:hypothetical protein GDO81_007138 [Engystomops pustulosus]
MGKVVLRERAHPPAWSCLNNLLNQKETDNTANVESLLSTCEQNRVIYLVLASLEEKGAAGGGLVGNFFTKQVTLLKGVVY